MYKTVGALCQSFSKRSVAEKWRISFRQYVGQSAPSSVSALWRATGPRSSLNTAVFLHGERKRIIGEEDEILVYFLTCRVVFHLSLLDCMT